MSYDSRALDLAYKAGFKVLPDGYVGMPSTMDNLQEMVTRLVELAQLDLSRRDRD